MNVRFFNPATFAIVLCSMMSVQSVRAADSAADQLSAATAAVRKGDLHAALKAADDAIEIEPKNASCYLLRAKIRDGLNDAAGALADNDKAVSLAPKDPSVYQQRAVQHFRMAEPAKAVADFDKVGELRPESRPYDWQRGIALYYAGRFEDGVKQFELHRTVNADDVENAAWHFLCVARSAGIEKARAGLIPIAGDDRVPMMKIHEMFAGKATPDDVIAEAHRGEPPADRLKDRLFYAHQYIGLYYEAMGDAVKAKEHMLKAAGEYKQDHYMGIVAQVHVKLLEKEKPAEKKEE